MVATKFPESFAKTVHIQGKKFFSCNIGGCLSTATWVHRKNLNLHIESCHQDLISKSLKASVEDDASDTGGSSPAKRHRSEDSPTPDGTSGNLGDAPEYGDDNHSREGEMGLLDPMECDCGDHDLSFHESDGDESEEEPLGSVDGNFAREKAQSAQQVERKQAPRNESLRDERSVSERNLPAKFGFMRDIFSKERTEDPNELDQAMMFVRKLSLLYNIPHGVIDLLLESASLQRLKLLEGFSMQLIDRKLDRIRPSVGYSVKLGSGTTIRYLPPTHTLLRKVLHGTVPGKNLSVYWDGFRKFNAKGGTLGGLYFASQKDGPLKVEDLQLVTLIPKTDNYHEDIKEVLTLVQEDCNILHHGTRIEIPDHVDFLLQATLKVVIGDLQGLPEIYFTRSPSADDGCGYCDEPKENWTMFAIPAPESRMTEEKLRESARFYEQEIGSKSKPTQVTKLQQALQIKGNSPLLHIDGFNPVDGRGLDAQHQLLGPVKETFKKSLTPAFRVKDQRIKECLKEIDRRISSIPYPPDHPRISRPIQNIADYTAEDVLALMIFAPLIFHGTINPGLYRNLVMMTKVYLALIYRVDRDNVQRWSEEARAMAKDLHTWMGWEGVTLNWHLIVHWHSVVEIHGPVRGYWAWVMERYNKLMKLLVYTTNFKNVHLQVVDKFELLWWIALKTHTPTWAMKKSEEENLKEKTSAPKGTSYDPLDDEREESFRCLGVVAHEYRGIKKCYKEGTRLVSGVSFVQFTGTGHGSQYGQIVKIFEPIIDSEMRKLLLSIEVWEIASVTSFQGDFAGAKVTCVEKTGKRAIIPLGAVRKGLCAVITSSGKALFEDDLSWKK